MSFSNPTARALIVNIGVRQADVNISRMLTNMSLNFQSAHNTISKVVTDLAASASTTFNGVGVSTALTMLRCSGPVSVTYTLLPVGTTRVNPVTVTQLVNSFLCLDDNVGSFVVTNLSSTDISSLIFIQG